MHLTNGQFVHQLLENVDTINDIVYSLIVSERLIKKYGKFLFVPEILEQIKKESVDLYYFLLLLKLSKKTSLRDIKKIISLLKKQGSDHYQKKFVISSSSDSLYQDIKKYLYTMFPDADIEYQKPHTEEIFVSGEGRYYKRGLEQDVKKILGL